MRKVWMLPLAILLVLALGACGNNSNNAGNTSSPATSAANSPSASPSASPSDTASGEAATGTITYQSQTGPVEVPANPQRVVVLSSYVGDVISLGVNLVGVDSWSKMNTRWADKLKDVATVSDENLEQIIELKPDLIIGLDNVKNLDKLKQIAPTVVFTYGKVDYLTQHIEIGKVLNKEKEATAWVDDFKARAAKAGEEIKAKIGADATVSVIESYQKQLYVYGDNWGRGTEILYQAMGLKMPQKQKEATEKDGYFEISSEVIPEYAGDYIIMSTSSDADTAFEQTDTYKNIPAVKAGHVFKVKMEDFYFNDADTLDYQLQFFIDSFLGQ
ncbi:iron-hydroxamate ABC transporter substrate-binding protein [Cohnella lubricantis]|uniref:Iron-hydroxamate ABC transporter substrate-binding protein n=1 Tax=Cohnella lubricantis TaxID=2163172 RepID=A0A841TMN9_9BACL|nr:iron-hydroxamate ABC transporter substrate-binding protein [Cohnella lubricantis]MBB6679781.1 iron-hydroxamate ABC transporter substrate-binding protein [Cohnella lubricantis]MBP2120233.1 iron complex transport system substrate-binding protein [Cohnella lubricantis]